MIAGMLQEPMDKKAERSRDRSQRAKARGPGPALVLKTGEWEPRFFNHLEFVWDTGHRHWEATGPGLRSGALHWWVDLTVMVCEFERSLQDEFGVIPSWVTIKNQERHIERCKGHPVFSVEPNTLFLRRWLDTWAETHYCRIVRHVFDVLRLQKGLKEAEAEKQSSAIGKRFEALFLEPKPTAPIPPATEDLAPVTEEALAASRVRIDELADAVLGPLEPPAGKRLGLGVPLGFTRTSGLRRNRERDTKFCDMIEKFQVGGSLNDVELRYLLQFYGSLFRMTEVLGQRYYLMNSDMEAQYARLLEMARDRNWTQSLINMFGSMADRPMEMIC